MLLSITTTNPPASDLGFLLHKHPDRFQSFDLSFGQAHVFYPEVGAERCTACLMLDVDAVGMVRRKGRDQSFLLGHYVNDRPYVASSFMSVAIAQVFGSAMAGRCKDRPELVGTPIPLTVQIETLPVRGPEDFLHRVFEPLGYTVTATRHPLDTAFPEWGESPYFSVTLTGTKTLSELLMHLYVLIPVFDNEKHYFVGEDELEKLLVKGTGWLASHPEKEAITRRYLKHRSSLYREALARLADVEETPMESDEETPHVQPEDLLEQPMSLHEQRHGAVLAALRASGARSVLDLGCGEGKLLRELLKDRQLERIVGMDVSVQVARAGRAAAGLRPLTAEAARAHRVDSRLADLPRQTAGRFRCGRRGRSHRAPRPAATLVARTGAVRVFPAQDGRAHDAQSRIQRHVGDAPGWAVPASRPPLRMEPAGISRMGTAHRRAAWLQGAVSAGGVGRERTRCADADGSVRA